MIFHLGTHEPSWLANPLFADVSLFVARQRFERCKRRLPRAVGSWCLDSGGFTELQKHGRWTVTPREYVAEVRRFRDEIGGLLWAAPQDWMCEPWVLSGGRPPGSRECFAGTYLTVVEHLRRTVENFVELKSLAPDLPFVPVLQGWTLGDYIDCAELYERAGVVLVEEKLVGLGTVCRRQNTIRAGVIISEFSDRGIALHTFGLKTEGFRLYGHKVRSGDSLAWSDHAKHQPPIDGHEKPGPGRPRGHKHCNNCPEFALEWRGRVLEAGCSSPKIDLR